MALESVTNIADLVITNPTATDPKSEGDDHIRNIKKALKNDLPNITGPITASQAELNVLDGITASTAELNLLDGVTATTAELNYIDGVTSPIQTQLDSKQPLDADLTAIAGLSSAGMAVRTGSGTYAARTLTAGSGITIVNGDGVSGNPVISFDAVVLPPESSSALVSYTPAGTGAVVTTVQSKLRERVSVKDFGGAGNTVADLLALATPVITAGTIISTDDGFRYEVAPSGATDHHVTTAGGVKLYYRGGGFVGESGRRFQFVSGVIRNRNDGLGWQLIEDASHDHVGVASIGTNTTGVTVAFNFTASKIISFVAGPDERMAQAGMTVGASVGTTSAGLWIGAPLQFWFDPVTATVNHPAWFDPATFGVTGSGATRTITHPEISSANAAPVLGSGFVSSLNGPDYGVSSFTTTGFGLQSLLDLSGYVYYNGSAWVISTDVDTSVHTITAAWEAANGGQLRVTHPACDSDFDVSLISASTAHRAFVNACADTAFTVQFFDWATNTQVASPVSPIGIRFSRRRRCRAASLQSGRVTCVRSQARLDPTLLHDGTLPLANIWFVGVFEV